MNDFIINVLTAQGPTIPMGIPIIGGIPINSPLVGSFFAIVVSVTIAAFTIKRNGDSNRRYIESVEKSSKAHIEAVEKTSADKIIEERYWRDLKRKQMLKSLAQEFNINKMLLGTLVKMDESKDYTSPYSNFNLAALEKCLTDTPIEDNAINKGLSAIYIIINSYDNKLIASRSPLYDKEERILFIHQIATDYKKHKSILDGTIKRINAYEQSIELYPLPNRTNT